MSLVSVRRFSGALRAQQPDGRQRVHRASQPRSHANQRGIRSRANPGSHSRASPSVGRRRSRHSSEARSHIYEVRRSHTYEVRRSRRYEVRCNQNSRIPNRTNQTQQRERFQAQGEALRPRTQRLEFVSASDHSFWHSGSRCRPSRNVRYPGVKHSGGSPKPDWRTADGQSAGHLKGWPGRPEPAHSRAFLTPRRVPGALCRRGDSDDVRR